ncbi:hypothetical protein [Saccharopolyspora antimicrobica]|nr:hypothetical protein [Saccharopolyspora antimicrobica]
MINPDVDHLRTTMEPVKAAEARFWGHMAKLGVPDGQAWDAIRVVLADIQGGVGHTDPWAVAATSRRPPTVSDLRKVVGF